MNRVTQFCIWLSRLHKSRGFGIQSPTDYAFVRYVVDEHWPYYAYETLGTNDNWLQRKRGLLCFRLANWRQAAVVIDRVGVSDYLKAGCRSARITDNGNEVELAILSIHDDLKTFVSRCSDTSVVMVSDIYQDRKRWKQIVADKRITISYDLYYCGILLFDPKRTKQHYIVNF